jgi:hypothetical protein
MPNPNDFKTKDAFMKVCIPEVIGEGRDRKAAVGKCNGMWAERNTKKAADLAGNYVYPDEDE